MNKLQDNKTLELLLNSGLVEVDPIKEHLVLNAYGRSFVKIYGKLAEMFNLAGLEEVGLDTLTYSYIEGIKTFVPSYWEFL